MPAYKSAIPAWRAPIYTRQALRCNRQIRFALALAEAGPRKSFHGDWGRAIPQIPATAACLAALFRIHWPIMMPAQH